MSNHIEDLISAYIDNELTENERQQVEEHLHKCPECSAVLTDLMEIKNEVFTTYRSIKAPETLEDMVIQYIVSSVPSNTSTSRQRYWLLVPLFSPLLFFVIAFAFIGSFVFKFTSVGFKVIVNLVYAAGSILGSDPYVIAGLVGFALLLLIGSSVSLTLLLKTKPI